MKFQKMIFFSKEMVPYMQQYYNGMFLDIVAKDSLSKSFLINFIMV